MALALLVAMHFHSSIANAEESIDGKDLPSASAKNEDIAEQKNIDLQIDPDILMQQAGKDFDIETQNRIEDENRKQADENKKQAASERSIENSERRERKAIEELEIAIEDAKKKSN